MAEEKRMNFGNQLGAGKKPLSPANMPTTRFTGFPGEATPLKGQSLKTNPSFCPLVTPPAIGAT